MQALSPLDGRYAAKLDILRPYFSEEALTRARAIVELRWFIALGDIAAVRQLPSLKPAQRKAMEAILDQFGDTDVAAIKKIEKTTNHDVKAVEYYLKQKVAAIPGLKQSAEFLHFGLTSEDVNNLAYGLLIHRALKEVLRPELQRLIKEILQMARLSGAVRMLSLTHGQPATPTTVGKELMVFVERLSYQWDQLQNFTMRAKFGGAVGNYAAHYAAYPDVDWEAVGQKFMKSLGFKSPLHFTTQINPHDDIAELSHIVFRIDTILINFSRDVWMYISRGIFRQKVVAGEVGSSTMPHKVNPIDFENAEGNLGLANAIFSHFAEKLPISRLQRDLSDSTVQRNIGVAFGYHLLAVQMLRKGLAKLSLDKTATKRELEAHPEVAAEAIQTVLRKHGVEGAYEQLKELTRGEQVTREGLMTFVDGLTLPLQERERLKKLL